MNDEVTEIVARIRRLKAGADWQDMADLIEQQAARIVELEKDAARYRWVRMNRLWLKANLPTISAIHFDRKIDAAIDAARRK